MLQNDGATIGAVVVGDENEDLGTLSQHIFYQGKRPKNTQPTHLIINILNTPLPTLDRPSTDPPPHTEMIFR